MSSIEYLQFVSKFRMKIQTQVIVETKFETHFMSPEQEINEQDKLKGISSFVKELKNVENNEILGYFQWLKIKEQANFLLDYLSRQTVSNKTVFFETLASFDSLLSIFKVNLFIELKFTKSFYRNIQREFQQLCLEYQFINEEKQQKIYDFQLYSVLFLLVMLIYFSGKKELSQNKDLPLNIINKTFINNFISLEINITQKNERIVGLIIAYLIKNINIKIYGQKMLRFILNHFDKILTPRTLYHFVYCLREIHLEREIDIKIIRKFGLVQKLVKFWIQTFSNRQSIYLVDYINVILKKYPSLIFLLKSQTLLAKLLDNEQINQFSIVHQGLILEIKAKILPNIEKNYRQTFIDRAFRTCESIDYSLKYLSCFVNYYKFDQILQYIFPFVISLKYISRHNQMKSIIFSMEILNKLVDMCFEEKGYSLLEMLRQNIMETIVELKQFSVCKKDIVRIEESFSKLISIQYQTLY